MNLSKKIVKNQELNEKNFSNTDFVDQDFLECILKWSNFENSKFTNVSFLKCDKKLALRLIRERMTRPYASLCCSIIAF